MTKITDDRYKRLIDGRAETARLNKSRGRVVQRPRFESKRAEALLRAAARRFAGRKVDCDISDVDGLIDRPAGGDSADFRESRLLVSTLSRKLIEQIMRNPEVLKDLDGHLFEDVVAEILSSLGFSDLGVRVRTDEGEVDIIGFSKDMLGNRIGYVFELKQRGRSKKPVSIAEVRSLYAIREGLRHKLEISQGVFATTTTYTRNAREYGSVHQLSLGDFETLKSWIDQYEVQESGLYLKPS